MNENLLKEIAHLREHLTAFPGLYGRFYTASFSGKIRDMEAGETRRVLEFPSPQTPCPTTFYALLTQDRAVIFVADASTPDEERQTVWLSLEFLLYAVE